MDPAQQQLLAQTLALSALLAGTLQYELLLRRRAERRIALDQEAEIARTGLSGLVRVTLLADQEVSRPRARSAR
jgi:hypothetical protein